MPSFPRSVLTLLRADTACQPSGVPRAPASRSVRAQSPWPASREWPAAAIAPRDRRRDRGREVAREKEALGRLVAAHSRGARPQRVAVGLEEVPRGLALPARLIGHPRGEVGPVGAYGGGAHPGAVAEGPRHVDGRPVPELEAPPPRLPPHGRDLRGLGHPVSRGPCPARPGALRWRVSGRFRPSPVVVSSQRFASPGGGGGKPGATMRAKLTTPCPIELDMSPSLPALSARLGKAA